MKILWIFSGPELSPGDISMNFRVFHEVNVHNGNILGFLKFQIISGYALLGVNSRCWLQVYVL